MITTFAVNSLWLHPAADLEVCISQDAADDAERRTGRPAVVSGPVIRPGFRDGVPDRGEARATLGVPPDGRVALLSTGSIGLAGDVERAARAIAGRQGWTAVVICGHDDALRERLGRVPGLVALGWVDDMPRVMAAADVLVDNAAGMSSKEALGLGLPVVSFRPLAGHGLDDARALARLGLTDLVAEEDALLTALDRLVGDDAHYRERVARGQDLFVADAAELVERVAAAEAPRTA
jgi:UDP-N-acetylglucosamine:LPS N-acetylglucosamine transferase